METGAVVGNIDVAQLVLYAFWIFFAGLVFYLRREDRREGYPHYSEAGDLHKPRGFLLIPTPKTFHLFHGGTVNAPAFASERRAIKVQKIEPWPGAPYAPSGDPLIDAVGPAAYAERSDQPDLTTDGHPKIVPLRAATDFAVITGEVDPRGFDVVAADQILVGKVIDIWVDRAECLIRYLEVEIAEGHHTLIPMALAKVRNFPRQVAVNAILSTQFAGVPRPKNKDQVSLLEEDKIQAYYVGGKLYATPDRAEPFL
jgi:photosynthetic reaction center H subunit